MQACPPCKRRDGKAQVTCRAPCVRLLDNSQVGAPLEGRYELRGSGPAALDCTQERPCALRGASHYGDDHLRFVPVSRLISCLLIGLSAVTCILIILSTCISKSIGMCHSDGMGLLGTNPMVEWLLAIRGCMRDSLIDKEPALAQRQRPSASAKRPPLVPARPLLVHQWAQAQGRALAGLWLARARARAQRPGSAHWCRRSQNWRWPPCRPPRAPPPPPPGRVSNP